jgi:hypothetical protein
LHDEEVTSARKVIEANLLHRETYVPAHCSRMFIDIITSDDNPTGSLSEQSRQYLDRGTFARAVWAQKAEELPLSNHKIDT